MKILFKLNYILLLFIFLVSGCAAGRDIKKPAPPEPVEKTKKIKDEKDEKEHEPRAIDVNQQIGHYIII
jgi:hypothetical protein